MRRTTRASTSGTPSIPSTILAYEMNDRPLPVAHGAPLRLRVGRQLGYKMAKYVMAVELVEGFARIEGGRGGYWEDRGYEWYAGIWRWRRGRAGRASVPQPREASATVARPVMTFSPF
jgi:DMSO/TMAO reductase YedYZ molybdopterin-dependent catalytic subunit